MPKPFVIDPEDVSTTADCCAICGDPLPLTAKTLFCDDCNDDTDFGDVEDNLAEDWDAFGDPDD